MSKYEDRTDPFRVKALRHRVEKHDHRDGVCDLLTGPPRTQWSAGKCYLTCDWNDPEVRCSCDMCSRGLREEGRKRRYEGRAFARDWTKEYA
jgi:hypothetical protein